MTNPTEEILNRYTDYLGDNDGKFARRVYSQDAKVYENRLKAIGFENMNHVLDAGCGFGQWTIALAQLNNRVSATDKASERMMIAREIAESRNRSDIKFRHGSIDDLPFQDNEFDGVFCYGAIFIANPRKALKEFYRVLKPRGKLYVTANGLGWTLNQWLNNPHDAKDISPRVYAAKAFQNTIDFHAGLPKTRDGQIILEKEEFLGMLQETGFSEMDCRDEGTINVSGEKTLDFQPFFKGMYAGFTGVYEVLASK